MHGVPQSAEITEHRLEVIRRQSKKRHMEEKDFKKPKVYLAGKITRNWWRNAILSEGKMNNTRTPGVDVPVNERDVYFSTEHEGDGFVVTGPHSVGCDHECFHTHDGHAAVGEGVACACDEFLTRRDVCEACMSQIRKSDIVFAYIDGLDAFGTFSEIGFARGCRDKFISVLFDSKKIADKLWFIGEMADIVNVRGEFSINPASFSCGIVLGVEKKNEEMRVRDIRYAFERTLDIFSEVEQ